MWARSKTSESTVIVRHAMGKSLTSPARTTRALGFARPWRTSTGRRELQSCGTRGAAGDVGFVERDS